MVFDACQSISESNLQSTIPRVFSAYKSTMADAKEKYTILIFVIEIERNRSNFESWSKSIVVAYVTDFWGPFLERLGNLTGLKSDFEIKVSRRAEFVLASNEVHFVSLADKFTV